MLAIMASLTLIICHDAKMDPMVGAVAINSGALVGGNFMTSNLGVVYQGLIREVTNTPSIDPFIISGTIFIGSLCFALIVITLFRYVTNSRQLVREHVSQEIPEPLTQQQKINLWLMLLMLITVLVFPVLHISAPQNKLITMLNNHTDVGLVAIVFSVIALFLKLAPQKEIISRVPWNTIIMICGMGMLIQVAIKAGVIKYLAAWIGYNIPVILVPVVFSVVASFMSSFSSTIGVVCPALFPLVPGLSESLAINPAVLFICIVLGSQSSAISPFSSHGSLILGGCSNEEERTQLFHKLLFIVLPAYIVCAAVFNFFVSLLLR